MKQKRVEIEGDRGRAEKIAQVFLPSVFTCVSRVFLGRCVGVALGHGTWGKFRNTASHSHLHSKQGSLTLAPMRHLRSCTAFPHTCRSVTFSWVYTRTYGQVCRGSLQYASMYMDLKSLSLNSMCNQYLSFAVVDRLMDR